MAMLATVLGPWRMEPASQPAAVANSATWQLAQYSSDSFAK